MTIMAALTASSDPLMVKVNLSKLTSAPLLVQMSESMVRTSAGEGARIALVEVGSGRRIHQVAL